MKLALGAFLLALALCSPALRAQSPRKPAPAAADAVSPPLLWVGSLDNLATAAGRDRARGKADAVKWINATGGIGQRWLLKLVSVDHAGQASKAQAAYLQWRGQADKLSAIVGDGPVDAAALAAWANRDRMVFFGFDFDPAWFDPSGAAAGLGPLGFMFAHGPTDADACRALVRGLTEEARSGGLPATLAIVGAATPARERVRQACEPYARSQGWKVVAPVALAADGSNTAAACQALKAADAGAAFLAAEAPAALALVARCEGSSSPRRWLGTLRNAPEPWEGAPPEGFGRMVHALPAAPWGVLAPGMATMRRIAGGFSRQSPAYVSAVCTMLYLREAMVAADASGGAGGAPLQRALQDRRQWVPSGTQDVCAPATWTDNDHRAVMSIPLYATAVARGKLEWKRLEAIHFAREPAQR